MLGFQHLYAEVDDVQLLKQIVRLFLQSSVDPSKMMIGVLIWHPDKASLTQLPWTIRNQPTLFPLMLIDYAWVDYPNPGYRPWGDLNQDPTYILRPAEGYPALDQLLYQLDHYFSLHESEWREAWLRFPQPNCDGTIEEGFTISAGCFEGPLVIGRQWMEYHK